MNGERQKLAAPKTGPEPGATISPANQGHPTRQAFVGAGGNLGDRAAFLRDGLERLARLPGVCAIESSSVYETAPVGMTDQPAFLNLVAGIETTLTPEELLSGLLRIEQELGRERTVRWGPRTLDLDLLAYEGEERATAELTLPHPRMFERAFVLVPLGELLRQPRFSGARWDPLRRRLPREIPDGVRQIAVPARRPGA